MENTETQRTNTDITLEVFQTNILGAYITLMTDKLLQDEYTLQPVDAYRKHMYLGAVELLKQNGNPLSAIEQAIARYSKIRTPQAWVAEFNIDDEEDIDVDFEFQQFKLFLKDIKSMVTFVKKQSDALLTKVSNAVDKAVDKAV